MPTLIKVYSNPDERESLFKKAKKLLPSLNKLEFYKALEQYHEQHGVYPRIADIKKKNIPGKNDKDKVLVVIGNMNRVDYTTSNRSRKKGFRYKHDVHRQKLYCSADGLRFYTTGSMKVKKGWLYY